MSQVTANNFIQVAKRFGEQDKLSKFDNLSASVLYLLAAPSTSDTIIEQVQAGAIPPNLDAIKEAKAAQKRAEEAERLYIDMSQQNALIHPLQGKMRAYL